MENIIQEEIQQEEVITNYDLYITKLTENDIISECSFYEEKHNMNITNIAHFKVTEIVGLKNNYKLVNNQLVELTDEEKQALLPIPQPSQQDTLNAQLLKDNASMKVEINNQKALNSQLLLEIAKLKGGTTNV